MGVSAGIPLGVLAATHRNKLADAGVRAISLVGYAMPDFYLGALLLITFALNLGWFPINGGGERLHRPDVPRHPAGDDAGLREDGLHRPA